MKTAKITLAKVQKMFPSFKWTKDRFGIHGKYLKRRASGKLGLNVDICSELITVSFKRTFQADDTLQNLETQIEDIIQAKRDELEKMSTVSHYWR